MNGVKVVVGLCCALIVLPARQVQGQAHAVEDARVESMDLALKTLAEDSAPTTLGTLYELLISAMYGGAAIRFIQRSDGDVLTVAAGTLSFSIAGIFLADAVARMVGTSTVEQARYDAFTALQQRGPVSLAAMRVLEGELYAQALSAHYRRRGALVGSIGLVLAGAATMVVGFSVGDREVGAPAAWFGGSFLVGGGFLLYSSTMESTAERVWREYHEGHLAPSRVTTTARVAIAPYASATGAGFALSTQM